MLLVCNTCKKLRPDTEPFMVPYDEHGIAMMEEHLTGEHQIKSFRVFPIDLDLMTPKEGAE